MHMNKHTTIILLGLLLFGCRDKFDMELRDSDQSFLVVEGTLNAGQGPTNILLTRSVNIKDPAQVKPVLNAVVSVENENGDVFPFSETGPGQYSHNQLPLVVNGQYRLRIKTNDNKEYLSDPVTVMHTPAIDSISWKIKPDGMMIYASTHDAANKSHYYKWDFNETWEIRSYYSSYFQWIGGTTIIETLIPYNYQCWKYDESSTIVLGSSAQLQNNTISETPVHFIPFGSEKMSYRYSILLRQQSLDKPAYEFLMMMKKNTESIGTIFDPQPSELRGNIKCISNPEELVVGYLTASSFSEKRIFITAAEANWNYYQNCPYIEVPNNPDSIASQVPSYLPWSALLSPTGSIVAYYMAPAGCVDCTKRGGSLVMPAYW